MILRRGYHSPRTSDSGLSGGAAAGPSGRPAVESVDDRRQPLFERIVLLHTAQQPDQDLLSFVSLLAEAGAETVVLAYPYSGILGSLAPAVRRLFRRDGLQMPDLGALPEPDLDAAMKAAHDRGADLIVMSHPARFDRGVSLARRALNQAGCSICFVPERPPARVDRLLAAVDLNDAGRDLLSQAVRLCEAVRSEDLLIAHACFRETLDDEESSKEQFRSEKTLALFGMIPRAETVGVACTPLIEESPAPHRALVRVAVERGADLVLIGRRPAGSMRLAPKLLLGCPVPVIQMRLPGPPPTLADRLKRVFSNPEPAFN